MRNKAIYLLGLICFGASSVATSAPTQFFPGKGILKPTLNANHPDSDEFIFKWVPSAKEVCTMSVEHNNHQEPYSHVRWHHNANQPVTVYSNSCVSFRIYEGDVNYPWGCDLEAWPNDMKIIDQYMLCK